MNDPEDPLADLAAASSGDFEPAHELPDTAIAPSRRPNRPEAPPTSDPLADLAEASASMSGEMQDVVDPGQPSTSRHRLPHKPDVGMMQFYTAAIPVLITVALFMLALGAWGILVKAGNTSLPRADDPNAGQLALIALVGLPLGLLLIGGAWFFFMQVKSGKKKLARYEEAMQQLGR